jgi:hypothetical protein
VFQVDYDIGAAGVFGPKTQSPSTLRWRLRVEVRHTCCFETTVTLSSTVRPHGQSLLPGTVARLSLTLVGDRTAAGSSLPYEYPTYFC